MAQLLVKFFRTVNVSIPLKTRKNGTLNLHAVVFPKKEQPFSHHSSIDAAPITTYAIPQSVYYSLLGEKKDQVQLRMPCSTLTFLCPLKVESTFIFSGIIGVLNFYFFISNKITPDGKRLEEQDGQSGGYKAIFMFIKPKLLKLGQCILFL